MAKASIHHLLRRIRLSALWLLCLNGMTLFGQHSFLDSLMKRDLGHYSQVRSGPSRYRLQIAYTRIDRDEKNAPKFTREYYRAGREYTYPASTVKLPLSVLALVKLRQLRIGGVDRTTTLVSDSAFGCRAAVRSDTSSATGLPSLENYIKRMLLVSDNSAYARVYDFVGFNDAQRLLAEAGFGQVRLLNRLESTCVTDSLPATAPVYLLGAGGDTLYRQAAYRATARLAHPAPGSAAGRWHRVGSRWVAGPKDFSTHNFLTLRDLHLFMEKLVFNNTLPAAERFDLDEGDRLFLLKQLGSYPRESRHPAYHPKLYYDSYKKYFMYGAAQPSISQDSIRVFNIVGRAYGFLIDCAYIVDFKNNLEFLLTCGIYVNRNGRIGSGKYEYESLGLPFMRDLSLALYRYERQRKREARPDLLELQQLFNGQ